MKTAERPSLIFCPTRWLCEQTALVLQERLEEPEIRYYHAGLSPELRSIREKWFFESDTGILLATCAYGMALLFMLGLNSQSLGNYHLYLRL